MLVYRHYTSNQAYGLKAFTGMITDSAGRKRYFVNGKPVKHQNYAGSGYKEHSYTREQSSGIVQAAMSNAKPSQFNHASLTELADHLGNMPASELKKLRAKRNIAAGKNPTKEKLVKAFLDHIRGGSINRPDSIMQNATETKAKDKYGYVPNFDLSKLDAPSKRELSTIEGSALKSNKNEPIIVRENSDGTYKLLDGYGRASGLRNAGQTTAHAIVIGPDDLPKGMNTIADDADTIAELHYKYRPESHLAKPGGSDSSGVYYNTYEDAVNHGEYDPIYPFMVDKDAWIKKRMEKDGLTKNEAEKEHREDVEDTLDSNPELVHRYIRQQYPDLE